MVTGPVGCIVTVSLRGYYTSSYCEYGLFVVVGSVVMKLIWEKVVIDFFLLYH